MPESAHLFSRARLYSDEALYTLVHLPPTAITAGAGVLAELAEPFSAVIVDKDEVTLILPADKWTYFQERLVDWQAAGPYRLITFDLPLDLALTGFMAIVSRVLDEAGIPLLAVSAFERDHLLVPAEQFEAAVSALEAAQTRYHQR